MYAVDFRAGFPGAAKRVSIYEYIQVDSHSVGRGWMAEEESAIGEMFGFGACLENVSRSPGTRL